MPNDPTRRHLLVLVRHAEASGSADTDHERPLTRAGRADAQTAGDWLAGKGVRAQAAVVSSAIRARCTWEEMASAAEWSVEADLERALYEADVEGALDLVRRVDEGVRTLVVVGHNPTMASLGLVLDDDTGDADAAVSMTQGFPPCSVAVFSVEHAWSELDHGTAQLRAFRTPDR